MPDQGPLSGQILGGRYRLGVRLGKGGFADVYLAEHLHLEIQYALKVLHTRPSPEELEKFRTEARRVAQLVHSHILPVRDFDLDNGIPFLVMDYAPNGTLRERHPRGTPVPLLTVVSYVRQIAEALQYAHNRGIVHRDIKPENMLLGKKDEVLLSDFGISIIVTQYIHRRDESGTPPYMAPEQFLAEPHRVSDQYSLAVVVYEWLCGERPFITGDMGYQHIHVPPPSLRNKLSTIPLAVEQVVLKALAKKPKDRFATILEFATALEEAVRESPAPPAVPLSPPIAQVKQQPSPPIVQVKRAVEVPLLFLRRPFEYPHLSHNRRSLLLRQR